MGWILFFCCHLANLRFAEAKGNESRGIKVDTIPSDISYSILSLNYDLIVENVCEFFRNSYWWKETDQFQFARSPYDTPGPHWPLLIKIHGSIDTGDIIPPTFNKGLYGSDLPQSWRHAHQLLLRANEIRVIGYSLPQTDSYIKYLLMASVDKLKDLDRIDWIAMDSQGQLTDRLRTFIQFDNKFIAKTNTENYLSAILNKTTFSAQASGHNNVTFDELELAHQEFFSSSGEKIL